MMKIKLAYSHSKISLLPSKHRQGTGLGSSYVVVFQMPDQDLCLLKKKRERDTENESKQPEKDCHMLTPSNLLVLALTVLPNTTFSKKPPLTNPRRSPSIPSPRLTYPFSAHCSLLTYHRFVCFPHQ